MKTKEWWKCYLSHYFILKVCPEFLIGYYYNYFQFSKFSPSEHAEADSFFCFSALMGEMKDCFMKTLDESESGIKSLMQRLSKLLERSDVAVWTRLRDQDLHLQYYGFRWLTLLLSQEFPLPDVVRIWDAIFADNNRFQFLIQFCCAMIVWVRNFN